MNRKVLLVIDMQNDFVTGSLANEEAEKVTGNISKEIQAVAKDGWKVLFTRDTHAEDYLDTQEGEKLPVIHCVEGTYGWQIVEELAKYTDPQNVFNKPGFGSLNLPEWIEAQLGQEPEEICLCGVCTDICVLVNGMILKAAFPEARLSVISGCCAGVTAENHENALKAMAGCQIEII